jgi:hypothetical protein
VGQERLGPSYFFISLVLGPLNSLFDMVRTFLKVYMELSSYFLFLQEQIKDIIIKVPGSSRVPCPPLSSSPHANSVVIGPAVIKHTHSLTRQWRAHTVDSASSPVIVGVGQEQLGPSHFFIPLVIGPPNSLVW